MRTRVNRKLSVTLPGILLTAILLFAFIPVVVSATGEGRPYLETDNTLPVNVHSAVSPPTNPDTAQNYQAGDEIIDKRTQASKTYYLGNGRYGMDVSVGIAHYKDAQGKWQNINNEITSGVMNEADYTFRLLQNTFNAGQVVEFARDSEYVRLQPMALEWTNDISQIQQVSMPQAVTGTTTNTPVQLLPGVDSQQGKVTWPNAYGAGRNFSWATTPTRLVKVLTIPSLANLPAPPAYIISGGNPVLRLNMLFDPSSGVDIYVDGQLWDKSSTVQTFGRIEFRKDGETLWDFAPLLYWDSSVEGNQGESIKTLRKAGTNLYIEIRVPYSWLQTAVYPVYIDAPLEVQVGVSEDDGYEKEGTGAMNLNEIVVPNNSEIATTRTWGGYRFVSGEFPAQGTTIDVAYLRGYIYSTARDDANFNLHFEELAAPAAFSTATANITLRDRTETSVAWIADGIYTGDFVNSPSLCGEGSPAQELFDAYSPTSIVVITRPNQDADKYCWVRSWDYTGNDQGAILHLEWTVGVVAPTVVTNPASSVEETTATLSGNITATGGANCTERGFEWDIDTGTPYADNWTEAGDFGTGVFTHGITSLTEGELYYYRASANNSAGWGYGSEVTFLTKPNPATSFASTDNGTSWISLGWTNGTGMDYVEVRYAEGSPPSDNVSGTLGHWGSGTSANVTGLNSGTTYFFIIFTHATEGGLWSTSDNSPTCQDTTDSIAVPTVVANVATSVEETTATLQGNITATGGDNATARRFEWGTNTGAYTDNWTEYGNYGTGNFTHGITGLTEGEGYYYIASANNSAGWGAGSEVFFITKPDPATSFTSTDNGTTWISLSWNNGAGMDYVEIRYAEGSAPSDNVSGTLGYWGSGTSANVTGLDSGTTYFFIIFTHATENSQWSTADDNPTCQDTTDSAVAPTVTSDNATSITYNSALLSGNITDTGGENADYIGFEWGTASGVYTDNWTEGGNFGVGNFTHTASGLSANTTYFWRAMAHNGGGWGYSAERSFATLEAAPAPPRVPAVPLIQPIGEGMNLMMAGCAVGLFSVFGFWRRNALLFMLAGGASLMVGLQWYDVFVTSTGLTIGLMLIAYALACLAFAFRYLFWRDRLREE